MGGTSPRENKHLAVKNSFQKVLARRTLHSYPQVFTDGLRWLDGVLDGLACWRASVIS
jgi:hypothetical protein